jgi:hypothetical protein
MNIIEAVKNCKFYYKPTLIRPNRKKVFTMTILNGALFNNEFVFTVEDILSDDWKIVEEVK